MFKGKFYAISVANLLKFNYSIDLKNLEKPYWKENELKWLDDEKVDLNLLKDKEAYNQSMAISDGKVLIIN